MSKPWGGVGAWAADAERAEAEEQEAAAAAAKLPPQSFPSLKEAAVAKPKKTKKMTLSEFTTGNYVGPGAVQRRELSSFDSKGLTPDEMLRLPKGPKERSNEEMEQSRGFRSYGGGGRSGPPRMRDDNDGGGGGGRRYGGFDDEMRTPRAEFDQPSRADGVDNWAAEKKPLPVGRSDRYNSLGGGSRADDVDNWAMGKKPPSARTTSFGSGFRDPGPREPDRWGRGGTGGGMGGMHEISGPDGDRERPKLVLDRPSGDGGSLNEVGKTTRPSPFGAARPREEILAEKGLDWRKLEADIETKKSASRPTSSHSSRPSSAHSSRPVTPGQQVLEAAVTAKPKVNPFGDAKPREVLLQEKGKDWRKIDFELEHRGVDRPESKEEQELKEEIEHLKKELEKEATIKTNGETTVQGPGGNEISLHEVILHKEKDLELLICELDDKVRFGPKFSDRPSSGAGRFGGFSDRPPSSHSGISEEFRNTEFMDRPRSRGTGDVWTQPGDDRRAFHSGGTGEFMDRPRSRGTREFMDRPRSRGTGEFMERPQSRGTGEFMDRPRSRGTGEFMDRPRSRGTGDIWSGDDRRAFQGGGAVEFMDRPRSHGTGDAWSKPGDDRRAFQGSGSGNPWSRPGDDQRSFQGGSEKGFIGNRDMDRTSSRNRW